jgi:hypothetical protein
LFPGILKECVERLPPHYIGGIFQPLNPSLSLSDSRYLPWTMQSHSVIPWTTHYINFPVP